MISVVMATYNGANYLRPQLDSIYSQTVRPDEVIVVDDCSTDETVSILQEYRDKYGLKYYINEQNLGVTKNFGKGIELSNGDYIALSDQDDVWFPQKIEKELNKLMEVEDGGPACVSCRVISTDADLKFKKYKETILTDSKHEIPLLFNHSQGCTLMFNKALKPFILPLNEFFIFDHFIGVYSCFVGNRYALSEPLMYYRHHGRNVLARGIVHYRPYISEGINLYYIMKGGERRYLLNDLENRYSESMSDDKIALLNEYLGFFSFKSDWGLVKNVIKQSHLHVLIKISLIGYVLLTKVIKSRQGVLSINPVKEKL